MIPVPTDNLYKFFAISGLIICGAVIYYLWSEANSIRDRVSDVTLQIKILDKETEYLAEDTEELARSVKELKDEPDYKNTLAETKQKLIDRQRKYELRLIELDNLNDFLRKLNNDLIFLLSIGFLLFIVGGILTAFGFTQWYKKVQEPQDSRLAKQSQDDSA